MAAHKPTPQEKRGAKAQSTHTKPLLPTRACGDDRRGHFQPPPTAPAAANPDAAPAPAPTTTASACSLNGTGGGRACCGASTTRAPRSR